tara:strand:+ start:46853 stop:48208 length:1356 start_codon:yes stop_codon:yes gene_type:complete
MSDVILFTDVNGCFGFGRYAGTYRIATELRNMNLKVQTIDFCMSFTVQEILEIIKKYITKKTKMVGISSTFLVTSNNNIVDRVNMGIANTKSTSVGWNKEEFNLISNYIKKINSEIKIVVGGSKIKYDVPNVDFWVAGEGENFIRKMFLNNNTFNFNTSKIEWNESDYIFKNEHLPIEIARGCIFKCSFCSYNLNGKKQNDYVKSTDVVREELISNYQKYGTTGYMFCDDTYNDTVSKVKKYYKMLSNLPFEIEFSTYMRLDLIASKPETIDMLYDSGCRSVFFGIETFNKEAGKNIGKGMDSNKIKDTLYTLKERWPETVIGAGFIAGLPHETEKSLDDTIAWLKEKDCPIDSPSLQVLSVGKNSSIGNNPFNFGIEITNYGWKSKWTNSNRMKKIVENTNFPILNNFTFYNRIKNLNIDKKHIKNKNYEKINEKYNILFEQYKKLILKN